MGFALCSPLLCPPRQETLLKMPDPLSRLERGAGSVIPAQAGIQVGAGNSHPWIPASAGMTSCDCVLLFVTGGIKFSSAVLYPLVHKIPCENSSEPFDGLRANGQLFDVADSKTVRAEV